MGRAEQAALSAVSLIEGDSHLSAVERRFIRDRMVIEERDHAALTYRWAARFQPRRPARPQDAFGAMVVKDVMSAAALQGPARLAWVFAVTHWNECNTVRAYRGWIEIFERISAEMAGDFRQVLEEERGHVAWGQRVLARLEAEDVGMFRRITTALQLTRRIYPTVVHGAHAAIYQRLRAAIR
jgi:hypothetical protein